MFKPKEVDSSDELVLLLRQVQQTSLYFEIKFESVKRVPKVK